MSRWWKCRDCRVTFEHDTEESDKPEECPDCGSHDIMAKKVNGGYIEHGADESYETSEEDSDQLETEEEDEDEPGSLFDKRETEEDDDDEG